jgi:transcriptional regulator with XRE-family HTH domain
MNYLRMEFAQLKRELLIHLRGQLAQSQVNKKMGVTFNKMYRWESGTSHVMWPDFVDFCEALKIPLKKFVKEAFSFSENLKISSTLVKHFVGQSTQKEISETLEISRYTLARWLKGTSDPTLEQVFALMDYASPDFLRFLEMITHGVILPVAQLRMDQSRLQMQHYASYPWLSVLLSALELKSYHKNPSDEYLAEKTKLPLPQIRKALKDFEASGLVKHDGNSWRTTVHRMFLNASSEDKLNIARYVYGTTLKAVENGIGNPDMRLSWKIFSLNKKAYDQVLQRYTEFFNDLGKIIDNNQEEADNVFVFSVGIVDLDQVK